MKSKPSTEQKEAIAATIDGALDWLKSQKRAMLSNKRIVAQSYDGIDIRDIRAQYPVIHKGTNYVVEFSLHIQAKPIKA